MFQGTDFTIITSHRKHDIISVEFDVGIYIVRGLCARYNNKQRTDRLL